MGVSENLISKRDATLVALVCATLGAVLSWVVFSSPDGIRVPREIGSATDWIAAIAGVVAAGGTWVIGVAANRFQRETDERRALEASELKREQQEARNRRLDLMLVRLKRVKTLRGSIIEYQSPETLAEASAGKCLAAITAISRLSKLLYWPIDEVAMLPQRCQVDLGNLEVHLLSLEAISEMGLSPERRANLEQLKECIRTLQDICAEMGEVADRLSIAIAKMKL